MNLQDDARIWWDTYSSEKVPVKNISNEDIEKLFLDKWSNAKKDQMGHKGLVSYEHSILKFHGCVHKDNVVVSINPSCKYNFIHVDLAKQLQVLAKHIQST